MRKPSLKSADSASSGPSGASGDGTCGHPSSLRQLPPAPPTQMRRKSLLKHALAPGAASPVVSEPQQQSPRMRRFAERLAVIQISLDPPSPPEFALQSPPDEPPPSYNPFWMSPAYENYFRPIEDSLLLQVPRVSDGEDAADLLRQCSPPPRRCSYASTLSENSSSISLNTSYQSLLFSPSGTDQPQHTQRSHGYSRERSRSSTHCSEGESDTPPLPTNEVQFVYAMARKNGGSPAGDVPLEGCACGHRSSAQMRPRRSHSTVSTPCELVCSSPTVLLSPVLLSRPIRSQSAAHSSSIIQRSASSATNNPSDSESELGTAVCCCSRSCVTNSRLSQCTSRPSNSSSPLATPPPTFLCTSPIPLLSGGSRAVSRSGSFSRHLLQHQHPHSPQPHSPFSSGSHAKVAAPPPVPIGRCHSFSRYGHTNAASNGQRSKATEQPPPPQRHPHRTLAHPSPPGTLSRNDSLESNASAGGELFPHTRRISNSLPSLLSGRPSTAAAHLQRSHSDALDPSLSRQSSAGSAGGGRSNASGIGGISLLGLGGRTATISRMATVDSFSSRRPSISLRDLQQNDLLNSSLDSSGSYPSQNHHPTHQHQHLTSFAHPRHHRLRHSTTTLLHQQTANFQLFQQLTTLNSSASPSNLMRFRLCPLGHSDPQIYTHSQLHPTNFGYGQSPGRNSAAGGGRRSFLSSSPQTHKIRAGLDTSGQKGSALMLCGPSGAASPKTHLHAAAASVASPTTTGGGSGRSDGTRRSPVQMRVHRSSFSSVGSGPHYHGHGQHHQHHPGHAEHPHGASSSARPSISAGCSSGAVRQPVALRALPFGHHHAAAAAENRRWSLASLPSSSGYVTPGTNSGFSSQYSSQENLAGLVANLRIGNRFDSNESYGYCLGDDFGGLMRPRSRSLTSPLRMFDQPGADAPMMSLVYKERFPKAKQQLESRLLQFLQQNAPLSGFSSQLLQQNVQTPSATFSGPLRATSPQPSRPGSTADRSSSPCRPQSPVPMRPLSPLVTESATAVGDAFIRSSVHFSPSSQTLLAPQQQQQLVDSGGGEENREGRQSSPTNRSSVCSPSSTATTTTTAAAMLTTVDPTILRLIADGATRFLHHQLCEIAADCLQKSRDGLLSCAYFCNMSVRLDETLAEAEVKIGPDSYNYLTRLVKQLLMIVSRAARLLECLEFDPDEFYQLLEEAEGAVRVQLGAGSARVPDLPQYIVAKLGLNKNIHQLMDDDETLGDDDAAGTETAAANKRTAAAADVGTDELEKKRMAEIVGKSLAQGAPKEDDFDTVRLISNGAYGAVYLVKHRRTRQRFALKKMKKQTLLLRNQIEQVYAERDILTFTDNPFVVCFYGSFETKQHLCMLMEYVEGGDCASLLKSAGTLPIELARLYVAETVLAIEYLHSCGIVHRDLKPDNLLITFMGHIKLTDFGLSKIGLMNRTTLVSEGYLVQDDTQQFKDNQLCGTPEYIAPEVILRQGYGKPVDWWALGVILYEFLVGIVPFVGDSPEALFANIINEEVEYPEGDEALDADAEYLIRLLLERNPLDRLGTVGGAPQVSAHPFFAPLDFDTILRQKAEFVPQFENDEDTSYFDSRTDRYNHDANESAEDDDAVPMFWSFSTASPRHSIVGLELPVGSMAMLQAAHAAAIERGGQQQPHQQDSVGDDDRAEARERLPSFATTVSSSGIGSGPNSAFGPLPSSALSTRTNATGGGNCSDSQDSQGSAVGRRAAIEFGGDVMPSAVILRRRFSNQRHHTNLSSTSSSAGTTVGTAAGGGVGSSTDDSSSVDIAATSAHFEQPRRSQGQLPRLAISPCGSTFNPAAVGITAQRDGAGGLSHFQLSGGGGTSSGEFLSPVDERRVTVGGDGALKRMEKRPSAVVHELITDVSRMSSAFAQPLARQSRSSSCRISDPHHHHHNQSSSLKLQIPAAGGHQFHHQHSSANSSAGISPQQPPTIGTSSSSSHGTTYYHSYAGNNGRTLSTTTEKIGAPSCSSGQISPSCNSVSSVSSLDSQNAAQKQSNETVTVVQQQYTETHYGGPPPPPSGQPSVCTSSSSLLPPPASSHAAGPPTHHRSSISGGSSRPIVIRKGAQGFGFSIRSVRVYLSEVSDYYSIEHIVAAVREGSPAWEAGLRTNDLITHVHTQSVHNMTHPEMMRRLLSCGNELTVHVVPLSGTSIKEGEPRRNIGKPLRKKPRRPPTAQQKGKQPSRKSSALLRRLSGKRTAGDIVPGTSSQKQMFMPRSVSSQEGVLASGTASAGPASHSSTAAQNAGGGQSSRQFLGPTDRPSAYCSNSKRLSIPAGNELLCCPSSAVSPLAAGNGALTVSSATSGASPTPGVSTTTISPSHPPKSPLVSASTSAAAVFTSDEFRQKKHSITKVQQRQSAANATQNSPTSSSSSLRTKLTESTPIFSLRRQAGSADGNASVGGEQQQQQRSPSPARRVSPSRLMQRFFRNS
uniref:non-specific serine/threonine protein kinase n=1 Tax=Globodera rostochiensis TaxID=31243 RepID=A0A914HA79_GLORO